MEKRIPIPKSTNIHSPSNFSLACLEQTSRKTYSLHHSRTSCIDLRLSIGFSSKKVNCDSPSGYRPISLLPALSKLLEKHIHSIILEHLDNNALISDSQWGFQAKKSTVTALLSVTQDWLTALDERKDIHCTFLTYKRHLTRFLIDA